MLMSKKRKLVSGIVFGVILAVLLVGILCTHSHEEESVREVMKDAVLHEHFKVSFFGFIDVNPGLISAYTVTAVFLIFALIVRIFFVPRFTMIPGKFQLLLEKAVGIFADLANANSPHRNKFLGAYIFTAGAYIFIGTVFELFLKENVGLFIFRHNDDAGGIAVQAMHHTGPDLTAEPFQVIAMGQHRIHEGA